MNENFEFLFSLDQPVTLFTKNGDLTEDKKTIMINFSGEIPIMEAEIFSMEPAKVARMLDVYSGGKTPWITPEHIYNKFYKVISPFGDFDSVHLEVIVSNILRWKKDPRIPARVKRPYEPATFSAKDLPLLMSWTLGLVFENFNKSVSYGILSDRGKESDIEKVFFGIPLSMSEEEYLKKISKFK